MRRQTRRPAGPATGRSRPHLVAAGPCSGTAPLLFSPARDPTRGTGPPPAQERPEEPEPRRPGPSASWPPGIRDAPSARPRARRARPACSQSSQTAAGSSARLVRTFRADAGRHRAPSSRSRVVVCICGRERGPAVPTASRLGREGAGQGSRVVGRPHLRRELWTPGRSPPPPRRPNRPLRGAQAVRLRLQLRPCVRPERPLPPAAAPGRLEAPRRPGAAPPRSPGRGSLRKGPRGRPRRRTEGPPVLAPRKLCSVPAGRVRSAGPLEGLAQTPWHRPGSLCSRDPRRPGWRLATPLHSSQRPL